jgi:hypothetical protein
MDPGGDDPSQQRGELNDLVMLELAGGLTSAQAHRSCARRPPSWRAVAVRGHPAWAAVVGFPGSCVMGHPATSQQQ